MKCADCKKVRATVARTENLRRVSMCAGCAVDHASEGAVTSAATNLEIWNKARAEVQAFAESLAAMTDDELFETTKSAIYDTALVGRFRDYWPDHAKCTLIYNECERRHNGDGTSIYGRAYARLMREMGYGT